MDCVLLLCASLRSHHPPSPPFVSTRRHREMKLGFVLQTAVALHLLLSPAQVGSCVQGRSISQKRAEGRFSLFLSFFWGGGVLKPKLELLCKDFTLLRPQRNSFTKRRRTVMHEVSMINCGLTASHPFKRAPVSSLHS